MHLKVNTPILSWIQIFFLSLLSLHRSLSSTAAASPSPPSYNVYNYDYTTPIFTPDGLLKQVEYASLASSHSSPLVVVPVIIHGSEIRSNEGDRTKTNDLGVEDQKDYDNESKCYIIMASKSLVSNEPKTGDGDEKELHDTKNEIKGQSKIIPIPISPPQEKTSSSLLVGMNGLLPDCMYLLRYARDELHSYHKTYGINRIHTRRDGTKDYHHGSSSFSSSIFASASSCGYRFAKSIAEKCQRHSFGGGLRAFGSQIVVCGVDRTMMNVFITDPSGAIHHREYNSNNGRRKNNVSGDLVQDVIVLGGHERIQKQIKEKIVERCRGLNEDHNLKDIVRAIYECLGENIDGSFDNRKSDGDETQTNNLSKVEIILLGHDNCQSIGDEHLKNIVNNL